MRTWEQEVVVHKQVRLGAVAAGVFIHPHLQVAHVVLRASCQQHQVCTASSCVSAQQRTALVNAARLLAAA